MSGLEDFIKYDYTTIRSSLDDIAARYTVLLGQADQIREEQKKFETSWQDEESATAYQQVQTKWNTSFEDINTLLNNVKNAAEGAVTSMQATNRAAAQGWGG